MTNYNERLERARAEIREILFSYSDPSGPNLHESTENAMAEITQLFKDLVTEAKPEEYEDYYATNPVEKGRKMGYNEATREFEQNLLKELEEV